MRHPSRENFFSPPPLSLGRCDEPRLVAGLLSSEVGSSLFRQNGRLSSAGPREGSTSFLSASASSDSRPTPGRESSDPSSGLLAFNLDELGPIGQSIEEIFVNNFVRNCYPRLVGTAASRIPFCRMIADDDSEETLPQSSLDERKKDKGKKKTKQTTYGQMPEQLGVGFLSPYHGKESPP